MRELYEIKREDLPRCAETMARAFIDDPVYKYMVGRPGVSYKDSYRYSLVTLRSVYGIARLYATSDKFEGLMAMFPPAHNRVPSMAFVRSGGWRLPFTTRGDILSRSLKYENNNVKIRKKLAGGEAWYLFMLAVEPTQQKKGYCSAMMHPFLKWLDENGQTCYLETHKAANVDIYKHWGFELRDIDAIPGTEDTQYTMIRNQV